ncbi:MAG: sigma-70 family RNA polymerase sigma factor [Bacteroidia bacterium]|nr:sigma-70 family RNA polymerase sigma factor [Bacteroidia bacterium]
MIVASKYTEAELAEGCKRGEPVYQRALYQHYHRLMFGVCLRYADNHEDAKDILQEGFIKVFKYISSFEGKGSFEGWIRRIMVHTSIEHYRRNSRYFMVDIEEARQVHLDTDMLGALSREEILGLVRQLPVGYRTIFNLYAIEGFSHQEIAEMLNISAGTSKSQLSRAKKLLQDRIEYMNMSVTGSE